jgi:cytochrome b6-f complex iron-sulfur subunit
MEKNIEKISRNEFLKNLGFKGAALMAVYGVSEALSSCKNESGMITPQADVTIDLNLTANAALKNIGGYLVLTTNNIVVARTSAGYVAVTLICSHEQQKQITFKNNEFYCTAHGARYNTVGGGLNTEAKNGLRTYPTTLNANILTIKI